MSHLSIQRTQSLHETNLKICLLLCRTDTAIKERSATPLFKTRHNLCQLSLFFLRSKMRGVEEVHMSDLDDINELLGREF